MPNKKFTFKLGLVWLGKAGRNFHKLCAAGEWQIVEFQIR